MQPKWCPANRFLPHQVPTSLLPWLTNTQSMTAQLEQTYGQPLDVTLLSSRWRALPTELQTYLSDTSHAYTFIPPRTMQQSGGQLGQLSTKPLGKFLFADRTTRRCQVAFARLQPWHRDFQIAKTYTRHHTETLWGRRSTFYWRQCPLLLIETFLPEIHA
jgi:chorismate--pyruvate lyase